jgi:RNA polymerase sigma-70 factor, ECF subfamily
VAEIEQEVAELFAKEADGIVRYAGAMADNREMANDALQEAFFRYFLCRSGGQQIRSPKAWLFRVAHNYILDQKRARSQNDVGLDCVRDLAGPAVSPAAEREVADLLAWLKRIGLTDREIDCVRLRAEELSYDEISAVLGLKSGTVGAFLARAHSKIRRALAEEGEDGSLARLIAGERRYASW